MDQIVSISVALESRKDASKEACVVIHTTATTSTSDARSYFIPLKTHKEALDTADRLMAVMKKTGKGSENAK